jgi:hypothetical protein
MISSREVWSWEMWEAEVRGERRVGWEQEGQGARGGWREHRIKAHRGQSGV